MKFRKVSNSWSVLDGHWYSKAQARFEKWYSTAEGARSGALIWV